MSAILCLLLFNLAGLLEAAQDPMLTTSRWAVDEGPGDREDRLLRRMFAAGLQDAALRYVRSRQSLESTSDSIAWWVMREMECLAQLALRDRAESERYWQACWEVAQSYRSDRIPDGNVNLDSRWPWIAWQTGRCQLLRLQTALAIVLANPANVSQRENAMELARMILKDMDSLQSDIKRRQPLAARQAPGDGSEAPSEQLRNLEADSQLLVAETLLIRAQLYPAGSADRAAALAEVLVSVGDVLGRTGQDWPLRPAMQLAEATAELEMGDTLAIEKLQQIMLGQGDIQTRLLAGIAGAKALAKNGDLTKASDWMESLEPLAESEPSVLPHWMLARMAVQLWDIENQPSSMREAQLKLLAIESKRFGERFGDYWRMRAESLMLDNLSSREIADSQLAMDVLLAEVRQLVAAGQIPVAVEKLTRARDRQWQAGSGLSALELASSASALLRENEQWSQAISVLEPVAIGLSTVEGADGAHLWVIRSYAEQLRSNPTDDSAAQSYQDALIRHLELWPQSNSTDQAQDWLEDWLINTNHRQLLTKLLQQRLQQVTNTELANLLLNKIMQQLLMLSKSQFQTIMKDWSNAAPQFAIPSAEAATLRLLLAVESLMEAEGLSHWSDKETVNQRLELFQQWLRAAESQSFQIRSLIEVADLIDRLREGRSFPSHQWESLSQIPVDARPIVAVALVEALDSVELAARSQLLGPFQLPNHWFDPGLSERTDNQNKLTQVPPLAQIALLRLALDQAESGSSPLWERTVKEHARNGPLQLMVAYHYLHRGQTERAIDIAKRIAALSPPGSILQLSARWCLLRGQRRLGLEEDARRAARLTLAAQIELSQRWTLRFEQLASP